MRNLAIKSCVKIELIFDLLVQIEIATAKLDKYYYY